MAERSQFWQTGTTGDGATPIAEAQTTEWFRDLTTPRGDANSPNTSQGPLRGVLGELAVTGAASPVSVAAGAAAVAGYYYKNDAAVSVAIPTPTGATRIDRIVLRVSHGTTRTVRVVRLAGTEGQAAPALTQTAGTTWDIPLAQVSITTGGVITVTDQRAFAQLATNHVKRDGDTMTGALTVPTLTVSGSATIAALTVAGSAPWTAANDGNGSGLDADKVAGVDIAPIRRQGGDANAWATGGTTNYTPTATLEQVGLANVSLVSGQPTAAIDVTFPVTFAGTPNIQLTLDEGVGAIAGFAIARTALVTASGFRIMLRRENNVNFTSNGTAPVHWRAIGAP